MIRRVARLGVGAGREQNTGGGDGEGSERATKILDHGVSLQISIGAWIDCPDGLSTAARSRDEDLSKTYVGVLVAGSRTDHRAAAGGTEPPIEFGA